MGSVITGVQVRSMSLDIPLSDFAELPRQLGCSLHRRRDAVVLSGERGGCAMTFTVDDIRATLSHIAIANDVNGAFTRDVLIALFVAYGGELDALLDWGTGTPDDSLVIKAGETSHPLLAQQPELPFPAVADATFALIEQWQHDARTAWDEYQRLKLARSGTSTSSG